MEPIKVSVDVNVDISESAKAFITALFAKSSTTAHEAPTTSAKPAPEAPATTAKSAPEAPTALAKPAPEAPATSAKPAPEAPATSAKPATPAPTPTHAITIEDVRKALSEKVNAHRNEIKDKLSALGAPSVTKLDSSKYDEMYNFLKSL